MVCRTMKGWGSFKRICSASVVQVQFFYGTRKMFCLRYSGRRVNNSSLARYYNYYIIESHEISNYLCIWQSIFCGNRHFPQEFDSIKVLSHYWFWRYLNFFFLRMFLHDNQVYKVLFCSLVRNMQYSSLNLL